MLFLETLVVLRAGQNLYITSLVKEIYQKTVSEPVKVKGIGLHTGLNCEIKILPSLANTGIIFKRIDLTKNNLIKASYHNVPSARLCTTLENSFGVKVSTVEHLLAAFYIKGIDNALIEINNEEVPIMDGSAKNFLDVLNNTKIKVLSEKRNFLKVTEKIELVEGEKRISLEPNDDTLEVEFQLNYRNKVIGKQKNKVNFKKDNLDDVSKSRTFCLYKDIEKIKKAGLAKGGSLENAVVVDDEKILNNGGLRNDKEFVNHKILDLVGDFMLSGYRVLGKVKCSQGGHELTNKFLRKLLNSQVVNLNQNLEKIAVSKKYNTQSSTKIAISA